MIRPCQSGYVFQGKKQLPDSLLCKETISLHFFPQKTDFNVGFVKIQINKYQLALDVLCD